MARKIQLPAIGGIRKVIVPGSTGLSGTLIAEFGAQTITLAQLQAALGITPTGSNTSGSGDSTPFLVPGPGLSGGGPLIGNVPINLIAPVPSFIMADDPPDAEIPIPGRSITGPTGPAGPSGPMAFVEDGVDGDTIPGRSITGPQGPAGPAIYMVTDDGADGEPGPPGVSQAGAPGPTGPQGAQGPAVFFVADDGLDGDMGAPGIPGTPGINGTNGAQGAAGPAIFLASDDGVDGDPGPPGAAGLNGTNGTNGAPGAAGPAIYMVADDGMDGDPGPPGAGSNIATSTLFALQVHIYTYGGGAF